MTTVDAPKPVTPEQAAALVGAMRELISLHEKMAETQRELLKCMLLARLVPITMKSKVRTGWHGIGRGMTHHSNVQLSVQVDGADEVLIPFKQVPKELWPDGHTYHAKSGYVRHVR